MRPTIKKACKHAAPEAVFFKSINGSVRVYTRRHINGCRFTSPDQQTCSCPKWIYAKPAGGAVQQLAAKTPSFTEACEVAQKLLKGFDPEIRAAREQLKPKASPALAAAVSRYLEALATRRCSARYITNSVGPVLGPAEKKAVTTGPKQQGNSLLAFARRERGPLVLLSQVDARLVSDWLATFKGSDLTGSQRRKILRGFFGWCVTQGLLEKTPPVDRIAVRPGNRCGYFSNDQYQRLVEAIPFYKPRFNATPLPATFHQRLFALVELGRWAGMALVDIVHFEPAKMLNDQDVITYRRRKSHQIAVVQLPANVAARLRSIPPEPGASVEQPMRCLSAWNWRKHFQAVCALASLAEVTTEVGTVRLAHPHMLRDTFAIDAINRGVTLENLAKMLGHASVQTTQKSYLFWVESRIDHCIENQRTALARLSGGPADFNARAATATAAQVRRARLN